MTTSPRQQAPDGPTQWVADHRRVVLAFYAALALGAGLLALWNFADDGWTWIVASQTFMCVGLGAVVIFIVRTIRGIDRSHLKP